MCKEKLSIMRKYIILLLILVSSYYLFGQNSFENYKKAESFYENKDYHNAILYYKKYLEVCSDHNHMIMMMIAMSYEKLEDYKSAIEMLNKTIQIKRNYPEAYLSRGVNKYKLGDNYGACDDLYLAIEYGNKQAEAYLSIVCPNDELLYRQLPNCSNISDLNKWIEFAETYPNSEHIDASFNSLFEMYYSHIYKQMINDIGNLGEKDQQIFMKYSIFFPNKEHLLKTNNNDSYGSLTYSTFTDTRDNNEYKTVNYRGKTMFAENIRYASPGSKSANDSLSKDKKYGRYYNYNEACGVCPDGWELLDLYDKQAQDLVSVYWNSLVENETFFKIHTGRYVKSKSGEYSYLTDSYVGHWWIQSRELNLAKGKALSFYFILNSMQFAEFPKENRGFSVRCMRK